MTFATQYLTIVAALLLAYHEFAFDDTKYITGPFDEVNVRWYQNIGTGIILLLIVQIVLPHLVPIGWYIGVLCIRLYDRNFSCDSRSTASIIQEDYEEMYSGPEFIIHMRYAQLLTCIFITMTFSSAIPFLYVVMTVLLGVTFMIDKYLLLNYYRITPGLTKRISTGVLSMLPLAVIVHVMFGLMALSYPGMLRSTINESFSFGYEAHRYFNIERFGQKHMAFFCLGFVILLAIILLEDTIFRFAACANGIYRYVCCKK